jgi:hypothetical protein
VHDGLGWLALQIEAETEKARKRAERFGAEFSAPSVELILDPEELRLYYKITQPEKAAPKAGRGAQHRSQVCAHLQGSARGPRPLPAFPGLQRKSSIPPGLARMWSLQAV